jgi:hypothetical protein
MTLHNIAKRVADKDNVNTYLVEISCHQIIIRSQHGNFLSSLFHPENCLRGYDTGLA